MKYRKGYKYQLVEDHVESLPRAFHALSAHNDFIVLRLGILCVERGYAWDGCSGPTRDDRTNMRAGLVHDALYQLLREGLLPATLRPEVDKLFHQHLRQDGMNRFRAQYYYWAVRAFGAKAASSEGKRAVLTAP